MWECSGFCRLVCVVCVCDVTWFWRLSGGDEVLQRLRYVTCVWDFWHFARNHASWKILDWYWWFTSASYWQLCSVSDDWIPSQKQNTKENQSCLSILSFDWPGTRAGFLVGRNLLSRWRAETRKLSTTLVASFPVDSIYALNYLATVIET